MRAFYLFLLIMEVSIFANADICDSNWLASANGNRVRVFINNNVNFGVDIDQACDSKDNRSLHRAILIDEIDPRVIEVLIDEGADADIENTDGITAMNYAEDRLERAMVRFLPESVAYQREVAIYNAMMGMGLLDDNGMMRTGSLDGTFSIINSFCDSAWWKDTNSDHSDHSERMVQSLLRIHGEDINNICNSNNDRPIHLSLKGSFVRLSPDIYSAIADLIDAGADLHVKNDDGHSALDLVEMRYHDVVNSMIQLQEKWCRNEIGNNEFGYNIREAEYEIGLYAYMNASVTEQTFDQIKNRILAQLYRFNFDKRLIERNVLCSYRGFEIR